MIVTILGVLSAFAPFATDTYLAGFQDIATDFHTTLDEVQLSLSTFFFGLSLGQLLYGPLIDRVGRKRPLLFGISLYTGTSALAIFAPNIDTFIGLRFFQAVGGCAGMIISRAIIQDLFTGREAARALSLLMVTQAIGPILAPILGGSILLFTNWQGIFVFLVVLGLGSLVATWNGIPETLPSEARRRERPLEILRLFGQLLSRRDFFVPTLACSLAPASMFAFISGSPFVFMDLYGVNQQQYGWLFGLNALGMVSLSLVNRVLLRHWSPKIIFRGSVLFCLLLSVVLLFLGQPAHLLTLLVPLFFCLGAVPILVANGTAEAMAVVPEHAGSASSIIGVSQFGAAALVSGLVSFFHNGTVYPMLGLIFAVNLLAAMILWWRPKGKQVS